MDTPRIVEPFTVTLLGETEINSAVNEINLNIYVSIIYIKNHKVDI